LWDFEAADKAIMPMYFLKGRFIFYFEHYLKRRLEEEKDSELPDNDP
jgi:hypothetical protein